MLQTSGLKAAPGTPAARWADEAGMALNLDQIRAAAERVAASHGLDVVEIEYTAAAKQRALRVYVEKTAIERERLAAHAATLGDDAVEEEGLVPASVANGRLSMDQLAWVTHEDCEIFSRDFGTLIDVEDLVPGAEYTLEVSSPGLDRRLYRAADYERFKGSMIKVQTFEPIAGNRHWQGRITGLNGTRIELDTAAAKPKGRSKKKPVEAAIAIELANVEKANLVPEI
ncbi:MAG TPA: ribosome maturation factor RimP [Acidisarcina sp.]